MTNVLLIIVTLAIAIGRFYITPRLDLPTTTGTYEAIAHLFVGGLFGAWLMDRCQWVWLCLALGVSLLELVMFLIQKFA